MIKSVETIPEDLKSIKDVIYTKVRKLSSQELEILSDKLYQSAFSKDDALYYMLETLILSYHVPGARSFEEMYKNAPLEVKVMIQSAYNVLALALQNKIQIA